MSELETNDTQPKPTVFRNDPFPDAITVATIAKKYPNSIPEGVMPEFDSAWERLEEMRISPEFYLALGYAAVTIDGDAIATAEDDPEAIVEAVARGMIEHLYPRSRAGFVEDEAAARGWNSALATLEHGRISIDHVLDRLEADYTQGALDSPDTENQ